MIQSVEKLFLIMDYMVQNGNRVRIQDIASGLDMKKSTVHNFVKTLVQMGYADQEELSTRYYLTGKMHHLIPTEYSTATLKTDYRPIVEKITELTGETAYLTIQLGSYMRHELKSDPKRSVRISLEVGKEMDVMNSALGNVFMAHSPSLTKQLMVNLIEPEQIKLQKQLDNVIEKGYAEDYERLEKEMNCVAVPIYSNNKLLAAIGISGPSYRFGTKEMQQGIHIIQSLLKNKVS